MAKPNFQMRSSAFSKDKSLCIVVAASVLIFCALWAVSDFPYLLSRPRTQACRKAPIGTGRRGPEARTFYDDPGVVYTIDKPMINWDEKRREWIQHHATFVSENSVLVVTGSQPSSCSNPLGDHYLLRFFKNKVDFCRIHGYGIFYNNAFLNPKMRSYWAKIPVLRAAMVAHPEAEWLFWIDSDAIFTDMEFEIPFERYVDHNLIVHGWPDLIYQNKSWVSLNAGVFLMRNCQWSMDFLDVWAGMGPKSPDYSNWGKILRSTLKDKMFPESDDQSALVYLLLKGEKKWRERIYVENKYALHGYWLGIVNKFEEIAKKYVDIERRLRRHAEVVREEYVAAEEEWRRPFVTHFTGCQPCSGDHNPAYERDSCRLGMERALNFADNQVLRRYGFVHRDLANGSLASPLPLDYGFHRLV